MSRKSFGGVRICIKRLSSNHLVLAQLKATPRRANRKIASMPMSGLRRTLRPIRNCPSGCTWRVEGITPIRTLTLTGQRSWPSRMGISSLCSLIIEWVYMASCLARRSEVMVISMLDCWIRDSFSTGFRTILPRYGLLLATPVLKVLTPICVNAFASTDENSSVATLNMSLFTEYQLEQVP